jgi:hypothetical protein
VLVLGVIFVYIAANVGLVVYFWTKGARAVQLYQATSSSRRHQPGAPLLDLRSLRAAPAAPNNWTPLVAAIWLGIGVAIIVWKKVTGDEAWLTKTAEVIGEREDDRASQSALSWRRTAKGNAMELPKKTPVRSYKTEFKKNETPISEGGLWLNGRKDGIDWCDVLVQGRRGLRRGVAQPGGRARAEQAKLGRGRGRRRARGRLRRSDRGPDRTMGPESVRQGDGVQPEPDRKVLPGGADPPAPQHEGRTSATATRCSSACSTATPAMPKSSAGTVRSAAGPP